MTGREKAVLVAVLLVYPFADRALGLQTVHAVSDGMIYVLLALGLNIVVGYAGLLDLGYAAFFAIGAYTMAFLTSAQSPIPWVREGNEVNFFLHSSSFCLVGMDSPATRPTAMEARAEASRVFPVP